MNGITVATKSCQHCAILNGEFDEEVVHHMRRCCQS